MDDNRVDRSASVVRYQTKGLECAQVVVWNNLQKVMQREAGHV